MITSRSRYRTSRTVVMRDLAGHAMRRPWLERVRPPTTIDPANVRRLTLVEADTWFNLAARLYGEGALYWVLAQYNTVVNPFDFLEPGREIIIPTKNFVLFEVLDFPTPDLAAGRR